MSRAVSVPAARLGRWIDGFHERHAGASDFRDGTLILTGDDGAVARLHPPFPADAATSSEHFVALVAAPPRCAVLLIRRGGFACAIVDDGRVEASHASRRHVQGRTAAGGWSQQRFARRREKQANELVDAAVRRTAEVVLPLLPVEYVVTGGDRPLVEQALADPRLKALAATPRGPHLAVPDPSRDVVAALPELLTTVRVDLVDP